ncbi:MAG: DUF4293 domain-containing protein [Saprospiraceae bacterium]|nr:DUF4293 domain-containing protein [Saprospiraceae bacterium]
MIQRIQTIYLAIAAVAALALTFLPFAATPEPVMGSTLFEDGKYNLYDNIGLLLLFIGAGVLALATIFLFNNRSLQINLTRVAFVANFIGLVLAVLLFLRDGIMKSDSALNNPSDGLGILLPILVGVMLVLALRNITKDEKLVRSTNRLR